VAAAPTEGLSPETLARFKLLQQRFVQGLPARWQDVSAASSPAARRDALHRLAGGAGSYGFGRLGQLAREAEQLAMAGQTAELAKALSLLKSEIDTVLPDNHAKPSPELG